MSPPIVSIALIVFLAFGGNSAAPGGEAPTTNEQCDNGLAMGPPPRTQGPAGHRGARTYMNTQPVGFWLTGPAFIFETHLAGRPQADRL